jgi:hypothetical protein
MVGLGGKLLALDKADEWAKKRDWSLWVAALKVNPWLLML